MRPKLSAIVVLAIVIVLVIALVNFISANEPSIYTGLSKVDLMDGFEIW